MPACIKTDRCRQSPRLQPSPCFSQLGVGWGRGVVSGSLCTLISCIFSRADNAPEKDGHFSPQVLDARPRMGKVRRLRRPRQNARRSLGKPVLPGAFTGPQAQALGVHQPMIQRRGAQQHIPRRRVQKAAIDPEEARRLVEGVA